MAFEGMAAPLGMGPGPSRRGIPPSWRWGLLALFCASVAVLLGVNGIRPGRQVVSSEGAVAVIERVPLESVIERRPAGNPPGNSRISSDEAEANSGVKVIRQNGGNGAGGMIIKVPDAAEKAVPQIDARTSERSQTGVLPRISETGLLPRLVYARPFAPTARPMIGIVMTGVGIGARGTSDAIARLPGEVTLAFAPYGRDLENQVLRARRDGHEILLQVPMEPQDYPDSDPGPHTLKAQAPLRENIERLHWLMSRFQGYIGLTNFMGGRLMAETGPYGGLLEEINRRGLMFLDDGTAPQGKTADIGSRIGLPVLVADRVHEASGKPLETLLREAEDLARRNGRAILTVPALPANIEKLVAWERGLAAREIVLAPISAILERARR